MEHVIDIQQEEQKSLGRISTKIAMMLRGKDTAGFTPNQAPKVKVMVKNASALELSDRQLNQFFYLTYSGYPGGQKAETRAKLIDKKGYAEVIKRAVHGMLPNNKLRAIMLKNLVITE